jgi:hypothetical protein
MASTGELVDEAITARTGTPGSVAAQLLAALKGVPGVSVAPAGANSYRVTRRARPKWALITAVATAPTLLGLFFLMVKEEESCLLTVSEGTAGVTVRLFGRLSQPARDAIRLAAGPVGLPAAPTFAPGVAVMQQLAPMPTHLAPTPPHVAPVAPAATKVRTRWQVRFSSGQAAVLDGLILVGREPAAPPGQTVRQFIAVDDPGKSVSKTHFALSQEGGQFWIMDCHSTNGTAVIDESGFRADCPPGQRMPLHPPCRLVFGDLQATLVRLDS